MSLFNWEGAAIFGPGSEWFWAMAQFVVVVITLAGIYRQLRAQSSANAFHQMATLNDRWNSDHLVRARLALVLHFRYEEAGAGIPSLMRPMCDFFEDIAFLTGGWAPEPGRGLGELEQDDRILGIAGARRVHLRRTPEDLPAGAYART